ncbi:MAG: hypothetical protein DPW09_20650 [Anaerolineae bacterium]|nr:hypothetical protein [Anaerolineales bacterium]MCQ3975853.1 hypothetical protein [Anaerolineae bacterium]
MSETNPPENLSKNPYVGPRPFEPHEQQLFFGRDWEAEELVALIVAHPAVLFYAQSGAGKSSLLNAEVIPKLQAEEGCEVLPVARVRGDIPAGIQTEQIENLYAFNTLLNWTEEISAITPEQLIQLTLAEFLKLLPHQSDKEGYPALRVIIFDQFEELFTFYPQRWPEREKFFVQINQALADDSLLRVLFVIREDYLAQLDPYLPLLPEQLRYRFRLERLHREAALAAVVGPLQGTGRSFAPGVAEALVAELLKIRVESRAGEVAEAPGEFVEPVQLQVVCQSLWDGLPPDVAEITESQLLAFGNVDQALTRFYEKALYDTIQRLGLTSEMARWFPLYAVWRLRNWFERDLITPAGTRGLVYRGADSTGGVPNTAVDMLESRHIIRAEQRAGARWYELTHDRFIRPIQQSNTRWQTNKLKQIAITGGSLIGLAIVALILITSFIAQFAANVGAEVAVTAAAAAQVEATATAVLAQATQMAESAAAQAAEVEATSTAAAQTVRKDRVRPLRPGLSIGLEGTESVGTLGAFVVDEAGQIYLLSTTNSLGGSASRSQVLQPAFFDGGQAREDVIASQVIALPQTTSMPAVRMVALARLVSGLQIQTVIPEIGPIRGVREPEVGMTVRKVGRTTGLTEGTIRSLDERISVATLNGTVQLRDVIRVSPMSATGDGGALVVDSEGYAIGVIVATSERGTFLAPFEEVLDEFEVELLTPPVAESAYAYGLNDRGGEKLLLDDEGQAKGWVLISEAIGADPANTNGSDYTDLAYQGFGVIIQLNYGVGSAGTLPLPEQYPDFARRAANFVAHSAGANSWIVGYEMNSERYWPRLPSGLGDGITPRQYADCYKLVREAIHALPGHENDRVLVGPIAPWNGQLSYEADGRGQYPANQIPGAPPDYPFYGFFGDWIVYLRDILVTIGPENVDGIALHAYTHGYDQALVFSDAKMNPPFENYHYHFRTYRDQMNIIPPEFRHLPVYLTETNGGNADGITWPDINSGWVQNVYREIDDWNKAGNQPIRAVLLYRWSNVDGWGIEGKPQVQEDFLEAIDREYRW